MCTRRLDTKEPLTGNQINKSLSVSVFSRSFAPRTEERIQKCSSGETYRWRHAETTFHVWKVCHGRRKQGELVQEAEKNSDSRTFSMQGLTGLKGDPLRNAVRHLKNTFPPVFVIDDHSEPCEEAGSTAKQEQARKMRRCRKRGIKRRIDADEAHVGTRHGQQYWEELSKTGRELDGAVFSVPLMSCSVR